MMRWVFAVLAVLAVAGSATADCRGYGCVGHNAGCVGHSAGCIGFSAGCSGGHGGCVGHSGGSGCLGGHGGCVGHSGGSGCLGGNGLFGGGILAGFHDRRAERLQARADRHASHGSAVTIIAVPVEVAAPVAKPAAKPATKPAPERVAPPVENPERRPERRPERPRYETDDHVLPNIRSDSGANVSQRSTLNYLSN